MPRNYDEYIFEIYKKFLQRVEEKDVAMFLTELYFRSEFNRRRLMK